jgi:hypothetical protein
MTPFNYRTRGSGASRPGDAAMATITVQVWDATGNKRQEVELPDDVPIERILCGPRRENELAAVGARRPAAQLQVSTTARRASSCWTIRRCPPVQARDGDVFRLQPEITAG